MLYITKKNFFQYQSILNSSKNLAENRVLIISYLTIILLISLICRTEMLPKNSLLETSVLCSSSYTKERSNIISPLLISSTRLTSFLNVKKKSIIKSRSMMSQRVVARAINSLNNVPRANLAHYATHRVCDAEQAPKDALAFKNNPYVPKKNKFIRHPEVRRQECSQDTDCKEKACPTLCSPAKGPEKVTGHLTHGTPNNPQGTTHQLSTTDPSGQNKPQNIVSYTNAHDTASHIAVENVQATSFINQPHIVNKIITHEDKK